MKSIDSCGSPLLGAPLVVSAASARRRTASVPAEIRQSIALPRFTPTEIVSGPVMSASTSSLRRLANGEGPA